MCEQGGDGVWYVDSGATDHVTNELEQLALRETYHGTDQIHTASPRVVKVWIFVILVKFRLVPLAFNVI